MATSIVVAPNLPSTPHNEPLTSVCVVAHTYPHVAALPHVVFAISALLDASPCWTLLHAVCARDVRLVQRILHTHNQPRRGSIVDAMIAAEEAARMGDLAVLECLFRVYPDEIPVDGAIEEAAARGDLAIVQWLHERPCVDSYGTTNTYTISAINKAAINGHLDVLKWLFAHRRDQPDEPINPRVLDAAAQYGHVDVVEFLYAHAGDPLSYHIINSIAATGHIEMLHWLDAHGYSRISVFTMEPLARDVDCAAQNGHLDVVQWLYEHYDDACWVTETVDCAAGNGHFELVQWLHDHDFAGCSTRAMDDASTGGHLEIVQWLHAHRMDGCTTAAMDNAAAGGHLDIVQWLHANRTDGCTTAAMDNAAHNGHMDVLAYLYAHRTEGCTRAAVRNALGSTDRQIETLEWLYTHAPDVMDLDAIRVEAEHQKNRPAVRWLNVVQRHAC